MKEYTNISFVRYKNLLLILGDSLTEGIHKFHYEENTCPYNICHSVIEVIQIVENENGTHLEFDPHGLFSFENTVKVDSDNILQEITDILNNYNNNNHENSKEVLDSLLDSCDLN